MVHTFLPALFLVIYYSDGTMIAINTIAVENEIADNMYQRSELDSVSFTMILLGMQTLF